MPELPHRAHFLPRSVTVLLWAEVEADLPGGTGRAGKQRGDLRDKHP